MSDDEKIPNCPDPECGVPLMQYHKPGCGIARCWFTGDLIGLCHPSAHNGQAHNTRWDGELVHDGTGIETDPDGREVYGQVITLSGTKVSVRESNAVQAHCWVDHRGEPNFKSHMNAVQARRALYSLHDFLRQGRAYDAYHDDPGMMITIAHEVRPETYENLLRFTYEGEHWFTLTQHGARDLVEALTAFLSRIPARHDWRNRNRSRSSLSAHTLHQVMKP